MFTFARKLMVVGVALALSGVAAAETAQTMATITNDRNKDVSQISAIVNSADSLGGVYFQTQHNDTNPPKMSSVSFTLAQIGSADGVVLDGDATHKAVILQGPVDPREGSTRLVVRYLSNGLLGSYSECGVDLRITQGHWYLLNHYTHKVIHNIVVRTWALGISTIENVCATNNELIWAENQN